jgi:hypothetical protein
MVVWSVMVLSFVRAFSSEVDTGSREENASRQKPEPTRLWRRINRLTQLSKVRAR